MEKKNLFKEWKDKFTPQSKMLTIYYNNTPVSPNKKDPTDVGYDVILPEEIRIQPFEKKVIDLEIKMEIPKDYWIMLVERSSTGANTGLMLCNSIGVIDPRYRGALKAVVINMSLDELILKAGERYFQVILMPRIDVNWEFKEKLDKDDRGGGFGSTGK